jgi:lipid-A-disaccharide synthase
MAAAEVVICASGTATLECMLVKRPMVVVYRVSWMTSVIARSLRLIKSEFVSLPNVLAGEPLVPELIQEQANGEAIAREVNAWLADVERRQNLLERFTQLHRELRCNAAERAAAEVQGLLERNSDAAANA